MTAYFHGDTVVELAGGDGRRACVHMCFPASTCPEEEETSCEAAWVVLVAERFYIVKCSDSYT